MISMPWNPRAALPTPRIAAFNPGLSPPAVRIPIRLVLAILLILVDGTRCAHPPDGNHRSVRRMVRHLCAGATVNWALGEKRRSDFLAVALSNAL